MTLINTLETPGEFDAMSNLRPGEPYFLLVGRDRLAPPLVIAWAEGNRKKALASETIEDAELQYELRKSTEAEMIAFGMQEYKRAPVVTPAKAKRSKAAKSTAYTGFELDPETAARELEARTRAKAVSVVNNAIAELTDLLIEMAPLPIANTLDGIIGGLRHNADMVAPARPK
jgi:hypothetical protein